MESDPLAMARELMAEFAAATGLAAGEAPQRYLWTDAFALCNFLELFRRTRREEYRDLARGTIDQVHHVLGRHREDDPRTGWISGLDAVAGERHPTRGGLRIGKEEKERLPEEVFDDSLEWERDGQYYHYMTKWMHALDRSAEIIGEPDARRWALELAKTVHARFLYLPPSGGRKRIFWKMSIDLSRPLVPSMGQHDPLDGLVTFSQLQASAGREQPGPAGDLTSEIADLAEICRGMNWATDDPLGTGGLLADAYRMAQLMTRDAFGERGVLESTLDAALVGLQAFAARSPFRLPAGYRLAFRELGLAIGVKGIEKLWRLAASDPGRFGPSLVRRIEPLRRYEGFSERIEAFWLEPANRESESWQAHRNINAVMLATSLIPDGFLEVGGESPG